MGAMGRRKRTVFLAGPPLGSAGWILVALPRAGDVLGHGETRGALLAALRHAGFKGRVALTATVPGEEARLCEIGAYGVFSPFADAADEAPRRTLDAQTIPAGA